MSGYDQFFKEAGKASGLNTGRPAPKEKAGSSPKFKLKGGGLKPSAEDRLRQEVALRARNRNASAKKRRQKFPVLAAVIAVIAIVSCTLGFLKPDLADQIMSHIEIGAFSKAKAEVNAATAKPAKSADAKVEPTGKPALTTDAVKSEPPPDFRTWSNDELSFFNKLNDRKKELDLREVDLNKLEEELQKQKLELDGKIKQLEAMRSDISKTLKTRVAVDQEKVDKLVQFYSTMKPPQAAKVIESLNEDLAVEVMDKMKKKSAAEIMNALDPKKARRLSELLTGYQRSPSSTEADDAKEE